ncbi:MAG TPA: glycine--tRNA ligase subunit beta, partial [Idiomarina sp.]|nr:glycine--tRNA ligase subunit beta [Idiomarina sp.]
GGNVVNDDELVEEVSALVEWPVALHASFDKEFLSVPKEPLIVTMKDDQRYFPVEDKQGNLLPAFIFITNIESKDPQQIISGNEKVVRPRLADAQFFFEADKKLTLES